MSFPRVRAPKEHGQILAVPPFDQVGALLETNQRNFSSHANFHELRALARREVLAASTAYHAEADETAPEITSDRWIVAGHQPELFHPGVWFKNFALHHLARKHGAVALNLNVDTDAAKAPVLQAPAEARLARVPFDRSSADTAYEERIIEDERTFADLPERMAPILARWNFAPMLPTFWREVMHQAKRTPLLGERFAAARRTMERRWSCVQREAPMSRVCQTEAFASFVVGILDRLPEFHAFYNQTVHEYRQAHGIRSRSHPVPDLTTDGDYLEAPFWAWRTGLSRRGKLMVRGTRDSWRLKVNGADWPTIDRRRAVAAWRTLESQGCKVRSRALTTTMFVRLFLADLFLHGIGGGIYDELTDRILARFFSIEPPAFLIVSATLLLPLPRFPDATRQTHELERRMRDLTYKPDLFLVANTDTAPLLRVKKEWITRAGVTHAERLERYQQLREINGRLLPHVVPEMERAHRELGECRRQVDHDAVASRRDYAFCLYPEEMLRTAFLQM